MGPVSRIFAFASTAGLLILRLAPEGKYRKESPEDEGEADLELTSAQLIPLAALLLATGLVAGVTAGLLGVGGGIVIVPVLFHVFSQLGIDLDVRMHLAVGTSLATIVFTALRSVTSHRRHGAVDLELLQSWVLPVLVGVAAGSVTVHYVSGAALTAVFASVALVVAVHMAFGRPSWRIADQVPGGLGRLAIGAGIGFFSLLMGLGGGTLGVPTLTLFGLPIRRAVGTAAGLGLVIAIPGAIRFATLGWNAPNLPPFCLGYVNVLGFALIVPATVLAAPWGAKFAHTISQALLRRLFAVFLIVTSARMFLAL